VDARIIGLFLMILVWDTGAQLLLKLGLAAHGEFPVHAWAPMAAYLASIAFEPLIWLALIFLVLAFLTWLAIIARVDLSKAHPATSFSYVTVSLGSAVFLHESLSAMKLAGILLIILGVFLVAE
jgi:drug/metabolite transporter (DMT)-like permease